MFDLMPSLDRIKDLYKVSSQTDTSALIGMVNTTFYDNYTKAKNDSKLLEDIKTETNPVKKKILEKAIEQSKKKKYTNALYGKLIEFANKENLNLNWVFYGEFPTYKNESSKIGKMVQEQNLEEHQNEDNISIPYYLNNNEQSDFIILPKTIINGDHLNAFNINDNDSMSPNIKPNSIIFIDLSKKKLKKACVYLVSYKDELYVKRLEDLEDHILLRSDNIAYSTITAKKDEVSIIGQVINSISSSHIE